MTATYRTRPQGAERRRPLYEIAPRPHRLDMSKFLSRLFLMTVQVGLSILVMINGWGLQPVSWFWILVVGYCGSFLTLIALSMVESEGK